MQALERNMANTDHAVPNVRIAASGAGGHQGLLDAARPFLAHGWLRGTLLFADNGKFSRPPSGSRAGMIAVDLIQASNTRGEEPALGALSNGQLRMRYDPGAPASAQAALLACAGEGGWPIARDCETLALLTLSERIAASEIPVLLEGPTGSGKEVFARFIHRMSARSAGPFIAINCAAMPEAMLEGLLFGHRKGAFTGAGDAREGLFRAADGGTLLLDEIGELPLALQAKLLRVLQEGEVLPLGATKPTKIDVRIVAATNRTLSDEVCEGRFREDLYYRLNVFPLCLPALRRRTGDIAPLAFGMLLRHANGSQDPAWIAPDAIAKLEQHAWPGNVRELENVIRRAMLLGSGKASIEASHIVFDKPASALSSGKTVADQAHSSGCAASLSDVAFQSEASAILSALDTHNGHRGKTARSLGISERTLRYRLASMRECGLLDEGMQA